MRARNFQAAATHLETAIALEPDNITAMVTLSTVYSSIGRKTEARALLFRALSIQPEFLRARQTLALWYYQAGMSTEALREFSVIIEHAPLSQEATLAKKMEQIIEKNRREGK